MLIITDGIGYSTQCDFNAFEAAKKPTYDQLFANLPHALVVTHGLAVGLPEGQMGNSEVGHMTIGAGRVMYQDLVKISKAVEEGKLGDNAPLCDFASAHRRIHIVGLLSDGGVHAHIDHLIGFTNFLLARGNEVIIHALTDGRDVSPTSAPTYLAQIEPLLKKGARLGSIGGRFYGMDRDKRWERIERGYRAIVEGTPTTPLSAAEYISSQYQAGITDEFIEPVALAGYEGAQEGDGFLFLNFRSDRMRQLVPAIGDAAFNHFDRPRGTFALVTMTEYAKEFPWPILFTKDEPTEVLAEVVSRAGKTQFHTAETEKYAHVTFFLNGGREEPFEGESRLLVPSPKVRTYDEKPQMSAYEVTDGVLKAMDEGYDLVVVNFANGDMVGHTGVFEAAVKAVEAVDENLGRIVAKAKELGYALVLTSDHGNCEEMKNLETGEVLTNHTVGSVWTFVMGEGVTTVRPGGLYNIAPTVLKLMGIEIPAVMDEPLI